MAGIHKGDYGTLLRFTIREVKPDGTTPILDLTSKTVEIGLRKPSGTRLSRVGVVAAPTTGQATYTTVQDEVDEAGVWRGEAVVTDPATPSEFTSTTVSFTVHENA